MKHHFIMATVAFFALTSIISCSKNSDTLIPSAPEIKVKVANDATLGKILTDSSGRTLYFFSIDADGNSGCSAGCTAAWPVFYTEKRNFSTDLDSNDFATITRADLKKQTTYKGWPLYYYAPDTKAGDVNGEAVNGVWFVAKPDYSVMLAKTQLIGKDGVQYNSQYQPGAGATLFLTDDHGRTLYAFSPDHFNKNNFTKADLSNNALWPMFEQPAVGNVPSVLTKTDFTTITVFGKTQLTYKGWPLYYFGQDNQVRGSTKGVSVPTPGFWPVVNATSTVAPQ
jgi:predicted lipoprotein with Yx(FWY)xxD motif